MKKLLLASKASSLDSRKLRKILVSLVGKPASDIRILSMMCPRNKSEEAKYSRRSRRYFSKAGIKRKNMFVANIMKRNPAKNFKGLEFDVFHSAGGNTFVILDRVRKNGFDVFIKKAVKAGKVYLGSSAGSILVFRTIEIAGWGSEGDKNSIHLKDLRGLGLFDVAIFPHYHDGLGKELKEFKKRVRYKIKELRDGEALLVCGRSKRLIR